MWASGLVSQQPDTSAPGQTAFVLCWKPHVPLPTGVLLCQTNSPWLLFLETGWVMRHLWTRRVGTQLREVCD